MRRAGLAGRADRERQHAEAPVSLAEDGDQLDPAGVPGPRHGPPGGIPRADLSTTRQLPTQPEQVLVTTGAQQALDLLMRSLVLTGQPVTVEDPTFPGALDALHRAGGRPIGLPADEGLDPGRLDQILRTHRPALVYLVPTHHNPTGRVMPADHRQHVAALAAAHPDTVFVDDLVMADLTLDGGGPPVPALVAPCPGLANLVTIGSLSKTYWGGLRIGWIRASTDLISRLGAAKAAADLGSAAYPQAIAAALLTSQHEKIIQWRVGQLRERRDTLEEALGATLPDWSWTSPPGGLSLWVRLPGEADAGAYAQAALRHGIAVVPGRLLSATNAGREWLRLAYTLPPGQLRRAVPVLAQAWQETGQARDRQRAS